MSVADAPLAKPGQRLRCLDGLRGVAALVVVFHHALLTWPSWAAAYSGGQGPRVEFSPLHALVDGTLAVYVFFVLSGLVLAWPLRHGNGAWGAYYGKRLLRLYLPVWAAIALAAGIYYAVPRRQTGSWWVAIHAGALDRKEVAHDATLMNTGWLNSVLWSLKWEVLFSLLLPLFVFTARRLGKFSLASLAALTAISITGAATGHGSMQYLPMFGMGVIICQCWDRLPTFHMQHTAVALLLAWASASSVWILRMTHLPHMPTLLAVGAGAQLVAATIVVVVAGRSALLASVLNKRSVQWLGNRSFSLYLVHEPVLVSAALLTHQSTLTFALGIPAALLVTEAFFVVAERPSHRLARTVGNSLQRWVPRSLAPTPAIADQ